MKEETRPEENDGESKRVSYSWLTNVVTFFIFLNISWIFLGILQYIFFPLGFLQYIFFAIGLNKLIMFILSLFLASYFFITKPHIRDDIEGKSILSNVMVIALVVFLPMLSLGVSGLMSETVEEWEDKFGPQNTGVEITDFDIREGSSSEVEEGVSGFVPGPLESISEFHRYSDELDELKFSILFPGQDPARSSASQDVRSGGRNAQLKTINYRSGIVVDMSNNKVIQYTVNIIRIETPELSFSSADRELFKRSIRAKAASFGAQVDTFSDVRFMERDAVEYQYSYDYYKGVTMINRGMFFKVGDKLLDLSVMYSTSIPEPEVFFQSYVNSLELE